VQTSTLIAIEQDVYNADRALIQRRLVDETDRRSRQAPVTAASSDEHRTIRNPLSEFAKTTPLAALVLHVRVPHSAGDLLNSAIHSPIEGSTATPLVPLRAAPLERPADEEGAAPPTPRQVARAWFEALYELDVYPTPALDRR
jgi:hypothetical protein